VPSGVTPQQNNQSMVSAYNSNPLNTGSQSVGGGMTVNITAMDAKGVKSFMMDNQDALVSAMKAANRGFKS
jgi:hypothetical protein